MEDVKYFQESLDGPPLQLAPRMGPALSSLRSPRAGPNRIYRRNVALTIFGMLCSASLWLLFGVPAWTIIFVGFTAGWLGALIAEHVANTRLSDHPIIFALVLAFSIFQSAYHMPAGFMEGGLLNPSRPKYSAFKALVTAYQNAPNGTVNQLRSYIETVQKAQDKFTEIPFDPKANPKESKAIADLYMRALYGNYDGVLHDDLYSKHMTPILNAVIDDVVIPEHVRREWQGR